MGISLGDTVTVGEDNLKAYVYKGNETKFKVVKKKHDGYGNCFNLEDSQGGLVFGVMEQDIILEG